MKQFSFERAQNEAEKMQEAIESGKARNYPDAEKVVEKNEGIKINFNDSEEMDHLKDLILNMSDGSTKPFEIGKNNFSESTLNLYEQKIKGLQILRRFYIFDTIEKTGNKPTVKEVSENYALTHNYKNLLDYLGIKNNIENTEINFNSSEEVDLLKDSILNIKDYDQTKPFEISLSQFKNTFFDFAGKKINGTQILLRFYNFDTIEKTGNKPREKEIKKNYGYTPNYKNLLDYLGIKNNIKVAEDLEIDFNNNEEINLLKSVILNITDYGPAKPFGVGLSQFGDTIFDFDGKKINGTQILLRFYNFDTIKKTGNKPTEKEIKKKKHAYASNYKNLLNYLDINNNIDVTEDMEINFNNSEEVDLLKDSILNTLGYDSIKIFEVSLHKFRNQFFYLNEIKISGIQILRRFYIFDTIEKTGNILTRKEISKNCLLTSNYINLLNYLGIKNNIEVMDDMEINFNNTEEIDSLRNSILKALDYNLAKSLGVSLSKFVDTIFDFGGKKISGVQILWRFYNFDTIERTGNKPASKEIVENSLHTSNYIKLQDYLGIKKELQIPGAPALWLNKEELARETGISIEEAEKITAKLNKQFPEQHRKFPPRSKE